MHSILCASDSPPGQAPKLTNCCQLALRGPKTSLPERAKGVPLMYARIITCTLQTEKRGDFNHILRDQVLPILKKESGFVDLIGMASEEQPDHAMVIAQKSGGRSPPLYPQRTNVGFAHAAPHPSTYRRTLQRTNIDFSVRCRKQGGLADLARALRGEPEPLAPSLTRISKRSPAFSKHRRIRS